MSPLTGGCHYAWECRGRKDCKACPAIIDEKKNDWSHNNLILKMKNIEKAGIKIIAASGWTQMQARKSILFQNQDKIENINSCIDTRLFNSKNRDIAKRIFGVDDDVKLIFCGAQKMTDHRKGFSYFKESLDILFEMLDAATRNKICILIVGRDYQDSVYTKIPFQTHAIDYIKDYRLLSLAYQASDIFVCPSIEDSGPMMVSEGISLWNACSWF
ncbi:MAG: hypothetical protein IPO98_18045 [Saprospiraceae bacterium]|nr:hypothetical protein [Saprospiraceae bacterium]